VAGIASDSNRQRFLGATSGALCCLRGALLRRLRRAAGILRRMLCAFARKSSRLPSFLSRAYHLAGRRAGIMTGSFWRRTSLGWARRVRVPFRGNAPSLLLLRAAVFSCWLFIIFSRAAPFAPKAPFAPLLCNLNSCHALGKVGVFCWWAAVRLHGTGDQRGLGRDGKVSFCRHSALVGRVLAPACASPFYLLPPISLCPTYIPSYIYFSVHLLPVRPSIHLHRRRSLLPCLLPCLLHRFIALLLRSHSTLPAKVGRAADAATFCHRLAPARLFFSVGLAQAGIAGGEPAGRRRRSSHAPYVAY